MLSREKERIGDLIRPFAVLAGKLGLKPNHITLLALVSGFISAYLIFRGSYIYGAFFLALSGMLDVFDGTLARIVGMKTEFGGILDSVMDRYVDIAVLIALGLAGESWVAVTLALSGSLMVSYTRARAEIVIESCAVGIAERAERIIILVAGIVLSQVYLALILIAFLSHTTAIHRVIYSYRTLKKNN